MFGRAMCFVCLVEVWTLDVWWSYVLCMFSGGMGFGCLDGTMDLGCLVELWDLTVWFSKNKMGDNKEGAEIVYYNGPHTQHQ